MMPGPADVDTLFTPLATATRVFKKANGIMTETQFRLMEIKLISSKVFCSFTIISVPYKSMWGCFEVIYSPANAQRVALCGNRTLPSGNFRVSCGFTVTGHPAHCRMRTHS